MRADLLTPVVDVMPGAPALLELELLNTGTIIDEVSCALPGIDAALYHQSPSSLRLFPGEHARVELTVNLPVGYPAGLHQQAVHVQGHASGTTVEAEARLDVRRVVRPELEVTPDVRIGRTRGRFAVVVANRGNAELKVDLRAVDVDQLLQLAVEPSTLTVPAGATGTAELVGRRRRRWFGAPVVHSITVQAEARPLLLTRDVTFRQKARIPSGALTAAVLMLIVGLWAVAVLFGVRAAMSEPPVKKIVPPGFDKGVDPAALDASLVGSPMSGKVVSKVTGKPLPRITVELFDGGGRLTAATATKDDGSWEVPAVLPGPYRVRFRADGLADTWYPGAADAAAAEAVTVLPLTPLAGLDLVVEGKAGSVGGVVLAGDSAGAPVTVVVEPVDANDAARAGFPRTIDATAGTPFRVGDLPTPANYRVRVAAAGFQTQEIEQAVPAGGDVQLNTARLLASAGTVGGTVTDKAGTALGDVTVTTKVAGADVKVLTPTAGSVGLFRLTGLPTPGTYVLVVSKEGYTSEVLAVRLDAGQERLDANVTLSAASGTVTGIVRRADGTGLGGVAVTVVGDAGDHTTKTFTSGTVGGYRLSGLALPGRYSLVFSLEGHGSETMEVTVSKDQTEVAGDITLTPQLGRITGTVLTAGKPVGGATITVSDGTDTRTTSTATAPATAVGTFDVPGLAPGSYTVTVQSPGLRDQTVLVQVTADAVIQRSIALVGNA